MRLRVSELEAIRKEAADESFGLAFVLFSSILLIAVPYVVEMYNTVRPYIVNALLSIPQ